MANYLHEHMKEANKRQKTDSILVSVICGVYNAQGSIVRLLDSLIRQSYHEIEIIMVVNGSTDRSLEILEAYGRHDSRVVIYHTREKLGAGGARAAGAAIAHGDYLAVVDCDDYIGEGYIKSMVEAVNEGRKPDVVLTGFQRVGRSGGVEYIRRYVDVREALCQSVAPWAKMYQKGFLESNGIMFRNIPFGEDILFTMEVRMACPDACLVESAEYFWVDRADSASHIEIRGFPEKNLEMSTQYIDELLCRYHVPKEKASYLIYKYMIWYLLQSGRGTGWGRMGAEYSRAVEYMDSKIPQWWEGLGKYIRGLREERGIVKTALRLSLGLRRIHLDKTAFCLYSILPVSRFWQSL